MIRLRLASTSALIGCAIAAPVAAQDDPADAVVVAEGDGSGNSGRVAINIAAGDRNQQAGSAVIAIGDVTVMTHSLRQDMAASDDIDRATRIEIGAGAFSNNSGMTSLNVTAGSQNQSANLASLSVFGSASLSDQMLAQSRAPTTPAASAAPSAAPGNDAIAIDDAAFAGNSGLVQLNVVGGERNSSANTFVLQFPAGGER
ncbi:hypothetical protein [Aurantiacibacter aquimixticola]|uniref:Uncharacterized protein n=1 Tax=Aurantiacibacter aquimixticola TaxID=1958945 RepID=A0A419RVJ3_9SPHN|nr:hypothetical protein [Aurantiacibacter aquimixticola]RJY09812.1 hypothetical protein D6201_11005 [Aurantiacibacter aquimixticola]